MTPYISVGEFVYENSLSRFTRGLHILSFLLICIKNSEFPQHIGKVISHVMYSVATILRQCKQLAVTKNLGSSFKDKQ